MGLNRGILLASAALLFAAVMLPEVLAVRYIVGGKVGWSQSGVNYTIWAQDIKFNIEDWLFFVYDRNQASVLEVKKTNYETCNSEHPLHNWTTGSGRDVVPLNVTKTFYFISGNGMCYRGMKVAIHVQKPPPPPTSSPEKNSPPANIPPPPTSSPPTPSPVKNSYPANIPPPPTSSPPTSSPVKNSSPASIPATFRSQVFVPTMFTVAVVLDSLLLLL